ncbi:MAG: DUF998 domain-containing protein [Actinobacteria bacterium]|nr:DUF998 domain-containing protein [Actinomycetota bacterium]
MTIPSTTASTPTSAGVRSRATVALVCLASFPIAVVILQFIQPDDYTPVSHAMSELALGRAGLLMGLAFCAMGTGTILVAGVLRSTVERMRVTPILLLIAGVLDFVSATFRINAPGTPLTTVSNIHEMAGALTFLLMTAAMFASYLPMRHDSRWSGFAPWSLAWAILSVPAFLLIPILGDARFGLAQRIFVGLFITWLITVALIARRE